MRRAGAVLPREIPDGLPLRGAVTAFLLTVMVIAGSAWMFWSAHERQETLAERISTFDELVWQAVLIHDARVNAASDAARARDAESLRQFRVLARDAALVARQLAGFQDIAATVSSLPSKDDGVTRLEEAATVATDGSRQYAAQHLAVVSAYRSALSELAREARAARSRLQAQRIHRSRLMLGGLAFATAMLGITWLFVIRAMARQLAARREVESLYRAANRQNRLILEATADGIVGIDTDGRVTFVNPAASLMLVPGGEGQGSSRADALVAFESAREALSPVLMSGREVVARELDLVRRDGTTLPAEVSARPVKDEEGTVVGGVFSIRDITKRRELDRMKSEFVATVSHELRTPLTSIRGALGLIAGGHFGKLAEKGERMLDIALKNTDRLVRLINDILDIERIESGVVTLERTTCNAGDLLLAAVETLRPLAAKRELRLAASPADIPMSADCDRITQVLTNLIGNAIKFSEPESSIDISVEREGTEARFRIRDHGRGIPGDKLESIFERFQQVDSSDAREKGGTGLGLPICRSIVALHEGRIWAESTLGVGSTFSFTLPCLPADSGSLPPETAHFTRGRVLVCEDDEQTLEVISAMLETAGYEAIPARTGEDAIALALTCRPDALLLDIVLPGISGWETIAQLQASPETSHIPILVLSGLAAPRVQSEAIAAWIEKPAVSEDLYGALDRALAANLRRVVIAEDDADLGRVLLTLFERDGIAATVAESGTDAVNLIERTNPDLVVLDLGLPGLDGFEVFDWMRRRSRWAKTPIVIYSARELNGVEAERLKQGPTELLVKGKIAPEQFEREALRLLNAVVGRSEQGVSNGHHQRTAH